DLRPGSVLRAHPGIPRLRRIVPLASLHDRGFPEVCLEQDRHSRQWLRGEVSADFRGNSDHGPLRGLRSARHSRSGKRPTCVAPRCGGMASEHSPNIFGGLRDLLNVTVLVPWLAPKFVPVIVTEVPTAPEVGDKLLMLGKTLNVIPLLACPFTVTTTLPV